MSESPGEMIVRDQQDQYDMDHLHISPWVLCWIPLLIIAIWLVDTLREWRT